jgi:hypothetical protein
MRYLLLSILVLSMQVAFAQTGDSESVTKLTNGDTRVDGVDPFGAQVTVVYNNLNKKVYQERTYNGETTFAKYDTGSLVEYGTLYRPVVDNSPTPSFKVDAN